MHTVRCIKWDAKNDIWILKNKMNRNKKLKMHITRCREYMKWATKKETQQTKCIELDAYSTIHRSRCISIDAYKKMHITKCTKWDEWKTIQRIRCMK